MAFDAHSNLAVSTIATAPAPATSGTTLTVAVGEGARFPVAPFNVTVWPATAIPTPVNAEVLRVTAIAGDALTITRAQEGTTARSIVAGDLVAETITAKALTDLESGTNFPLITTPGHLQTGGRVQLGGTTAAFPALARSGTGLASRFADDSGPADVSANQFLIATNGSGFRPAAAGTGQYLVVQASATFGVANGAYMLFGGNTSAVPGMFQLVAGNVPQGAIEFYTGNAALRGKIHNSGGFSWGGTTDPGAGVIGVSDTGTAGANKLVFSNANGIVGAVYTTGATTVYATSSDARLKTSRGRHTDPAVLRQTMIHDFTWNSDGTPGRGVFAQEAARIAPFAVSVGRDDRDDQGRLTHPWGVDYSKYVPDLISGWQEHDEKIDQLLAAVETNVALVERLTALSARPSLYQRVETTLRNVGNFITAFWRRPSWVG